MKNQNVKLKDGRLGRYKNRNEAGKKVTDSWDRGLSIGELKTVSEDTKIAENVNIFSVSATVLSSPCCWQLDLDCFCTLRG